MNPLFKVQNIDQKAEVEGNFLLNRASVIDDQSNYLFVSDSKNLLNVFDIGKDTKSNAGFKYLGTASILEHLELSEPPQGWVIHDGVLYGLIYKGGTYLIALEVQNQSYAWSNFDTAYDDALWNFEDDSKKNPKPIPGVNLGDRAVYSIQVIGDFIWAMDDQGYLHKISLKYGPGDGDDSYIKPSAKKVLTTSQARVGYIAKNTLYATSTALFFIETVSSDSFLVCLNPTNLEPHWRTKIPIEGRDKIQVVEVVDDKEILIVCRHSAWSVDAGINGGTIIRMDDPSKEDELQNNFRAKERNYFITIKKVPNTSKYIACWGEHGTAIQGFYCWTKQNNTFSLSWSRLTTPYALGYENIYRKHQTAIENYCSTLAIECKQLNSTPNNLEVMWDLAATLTSQMVDKLGLPRMDSQLEYYDKYIERLVELKRLIEKAFSNASTVEEIQNFLLPNEGSGKAQISIIERGLSEFRKPGSPFESREERSLKTAKRILAFYRMVDVIEPLKPFFSEYYQLLAQYEAEEKKRIKEKKPAYQSTYIKNDLEKNSLNSVTRLLRKISKNETASYRGNNSTGLTSKYTALSQYSVLTTFSCSNPNTLRHLYYNNKENACFLYAVDINTGDIQNIKEIKPPKGKVRQAFFYENKLLLQTVSDLLGYYELV